MSRITNVPRNEWELFNYGQRDFHRFSVNSKEREVPFTIPIRVSERYEIQDTLARGGGGVIFTAIDLHTQNKVLIKTIAGYQIPRGSLEEPLDEVVDSIRRVRHHLQTERRILVQLRKLGCNNVPHPHDYIFDWNPALAGPYRTPKDELWSFEDVEVLKSEPYLVMEWVDGFSGKEVLQRFYPQGISEQQALYLVDQVAAVIETMHQSWQMPNDMTWDLVYQDLKPSNILIDDFGHATLIDFGGCQIVIDGELILHGSHSPGYAAPECGLNKTPITPAADVYSLGTTLYSLVTGINLRRELQRKQQSDETARAVELDFSSDNRISSEVRELICDCTQLDPTERLSTAIEFRERLKPLIHEF
ncbi:Serine/threonine-protein kinase PrkC [Polystyrenella longa]|uniref:Serine/threonine-protein kinase PrkC n=1 Tax=Polystyrenella longa TaxID=2528007 RepID=A0A518CN68_9PLAN|nr:serine/threonine-protein kinase [Polystyrenella longa]QDU80675.1 Serine/threonine-protein kinase PrkC [Polystyrenella longa]